MEVEVKVIDDSVLEPNETFVVTASPPADPEGSRNATATITIIDNDGKLLICFSRIQPDIYCNLGYVLNTCYYYSMY